MKRTRLYNAIFVYPIVSIIVILISFLISIFLLEITKVEHYVSMTIEQTEQDGISVCKIHKEDFLKLKDKSEVVVLFQEEKLRLKVLDYYVEENDCYLTLNKDFINVDSDVKLFTGMISLFSLLF